MARTAVIGAGMGGMAAAARLAVAGHRVTVFERGGTYGGAVRTCERDGFRFDTGPGLLTLPAVYRDLFVKTGREPLEECVGLEPADPAARHVFADGTAVTLPNLSHGGVTAALDSSLGKGSGARWAALLGRARTVWEATRRPLLEEPLTADGTSAVADPYPSPRRGLALLRHRRTRTLGEVAAHELRDPRLAALLESYARAHGLAPEQAPASAVVLAYLEQTFGVWYLRGGMRELARAVYERCVARGVEFRFGAEVLDVRERDGRAAGVELAGGEVAEADAVVVPGRPGTGAASLRARLTVLLALRGARPEGTPHRTVLHGSHGGLVTVLRPPDAALCPDGDHETAVLTAPVPGPVDAPEKHADGLLAAADAAGLGLGPRVLWRVLRTPRDDEADTLSPGGLVPPPALAGGGSGRLLEANRAPLPGLYRAGGWAHPGGGLAHAGMSGALAAGLIVAGDGWRGSS